VICWKPLCTRISVIGSEIQKGDASSTQLFSVKELYVILEVGYVEILLQKKTRLWIWAAHCNQTCYWLQHYYGVHLPYGAVLRRVTCFSVDA